MTPVENLKGGSRVKTRYFALVIGIVYLVVGIAGFIPAFGTERTTPDLAVEANYQDLFG